MSKRLTDTEKWRGSWFQQLSKEHRTLWIWLCDRADNAGVIDISWPICNAETGGTFEAADMEKLGTRVEHLSANMWFIPRFVEFQFGLLSKKNPVHRSVEKLLQKYSLGHRVGHTLGARVGGRVCPTLQDKDKVKDKVKDKETDDIPFGVEVVPIEKKDYAIHTLIAIWCKRWKEKFGSKYNFRDQDAKAAKNLLSLGKSPDEIMEVAAAGWVSENKYLASVSADLSKLPGAWNSLIASKQAEIKAKPSERRPPTMAEVDAQSEAWLEQSRRERAAKNATQ